MLTAPRPRTTLLSLILALPACPGDPDSATAGDTTSDSTGTGTTADPPDPTGQPTTTLPATTAEPVCGDGFVDPDEQCDLGPDNADDGDCTTACRHAVCGDGLVNRNAEECDLGSGNADDGDCTTACRHAVCGDGLLRAGEEACDDGRNDGSYGSCLADCSAPAPACGDGQLDLEFEDCDGDPGCLSDCRWARSCLDHRIAAPGAPSGLYSIRPDGIDLPLEVWCELDAAVDGGGYTFLKVDIEGDAKPPPVSADGAESICADFGMRLFVPRSPAHLLAAHAVATGDGLAPVGGGSQTASADYLQILGIYPVTPGESCVDQPLNHRACPEWQAGDAQAYWVSDIPVGLGEPDPLGACAGCSMLYQWNPDGSVKSYKALPQPGGYSYRFLCDTGDKTP